MAQDFTIEFSNDSRRYGDIHALFSMLGLGLKDKAWVDWKYGANPEGPPIVAAALNAKGEFVGQQAYLPHAFDAGDSVVDHYQALDAVVHPDYRRMGIYQLIWGESKKMLAERRITVTGFPSIHGKSIGALRNEGLTAFGNMRQLCVILKPAALLGRKIKRGRLRDNAVARAVDAATRWALLSEGQTVRAVETPRFEKGYAIDGGIIHGRRTAQYLNWRFVDNPTAHFMNLHFMADGRNIGFCSIKTQPGSNNAYMYDFVAEHSPRKCIRSAINHILENHPDMECMFFKALDNWPAMKHFYASGFFPYKNDNVMFIGNLPPGKTYADKANWYVTIGDTDW